MGKGLDSDDEREWRFAAPTQARLASTQVKPTYTAQSSSTGSRASGVSEAGGGLSVKMGMPKEMGGKEGPAGGLHNPEELYVCSLHSTCFLSALGATHGRLHEGMKPLPKSTKVDALVSIGKDATDAVPVHKGPLTQTGLNEEQIQKLVEEAHKLCPYSRAIKGNVDVKLSLGLPGDVTAPLVRDARTSALSRAFGFFRILRLTGCGRRLYIRCQPSAAPEMVPFPLTN
ncbi:SPOSA6832_04966 [Sporobolomyces salmonicolor]|uniref:SPOSA6832_04966-mRNA-1:cds n=1 Tax=Sporidiobolus salmonicolor TaxID=5005 RepID=A0A0D6ETF7_SPOSA|nr:SPOSA6832_04966 [Sporobolomyces salmonicolor]